MGSTRVKWGLTLSLQNKNETPLLATRGTTCTNMLQLVQIYSLSRQTFLFIVQKSNLKWLRCTCNAKNGHQGHHLYQYLVASPNLLIKQTNFFFIVQKSNLKWLRYCCNAKNDHKRHHLCPALKPVLVVLHPKCGTIIKISPFYKTFTASSNLRSVFSQDLWLICFVKMYHQRLHMYQQLKRVLVVLDPKCGTINKISPFY